MTNRVIVDAAEGYDAPPWLDRVEPFARKILDTLEISGWELSVLFCGDSFIAGLNSQYRNIDAPTDVLSFEQGGGYTAENGSVWHTAGDIVISTDTLEKNAKEFSVPADEELKRLLVHGILHLYGMDHSDNSPRQEMLVYQEKILAAVEAEKIIEESRG